MLTSASPIRVMTVDDSATIRRLIASELARHPDIECLDGGAHPYEARERIKFEKPDVLILDVEMPHMNGLDFLRKIMKLRPMPVLMFSSLTRSGSRAAIEALEIGAVDVMVKTPFMSSDGTLAELAERVRGVAGARIATQPKTMPSATDQMPVFRNRNKLVLIGSSTGGVDALETVLSGFPTNCPPTMISQHMPPEFLRKFAQRINRLTRPEVKIAEDGEPLVEGVVYIAPGGDYHLCATPGAPYRTRLDPQGKVSGHRPSVDVMFRSGLEMANQVVAVILTGMGSDGAHAMKELSEAGARTLVQDEASCTVFGMPRAALELGGAERTVPLKEISQAILDLCEIRGGGGTKNWRIRNDPSHNPAY